MFSGAVEMGKSCVRHRKTKKRNSLLNFPKRLAYHDLECKNISIVLDENYVF